MEPKGLYRFPFYRLAALCCPPAFVGGWARSSSSQSSIPAASRRGRRELASSRPRRARRHYGTSVTAGNKGPGRALASTVKGLPSRSFAPSAIVPARSLTLFDRLHLGLSTARLSTVETSTALNCRLSRERPGRDATGRPEAASSSERPLRLSHRQRTRRPPHPGPPDRHPDAGLGATPNSERGPRPARTDDNCAYTTSTVARVALDRQLLVTIVNWSVRD